MLKKGDYGIKNIIKLYHMKIKNKIIITTVISILAIIISIYTILHFIGNKSLVGEWSYKKKGTEFVYIFNEDKTGSYTVSGTTMTFTYEDNDESISLLFQGNTSPKNLEYKIKGRKLYLKDSLGKETELNRQK